ncbi:MAG: hypothetical protein ABI614_00970 [Planctomycetota bacterium]
MAKRSKQPRSGVSPGKVILIGVLSVVLLLVIVSQFSGKKQNAAAPTARRTATKRAEPTPLPSEPAPVIAAKRSENPWPTFDVSAVVASNPFKLPEVLRPGQESTSTLTATTESREDGANILAAEIREMRRRQAEFMAGLRASGVDMILRSPRGSVARIGDLNLRVGDVHEGLRVEAIDLDGVTFAPTAMADTQPE